MSEFLSNRNDILDNLDSNNIGVNIYAREDSNGLNKGILCDLTGIECLIQRSIESLYVIISREIVAVNDLRVYIRTKVGDEVKVLGVGYIASSSLNLLSNYILGLGGKVYSCEDNKLTLYDSKNIENILLDL